MAVYINISLLVGVIKTINGDTICVPLPKFAHQVQTLSRIDVFLNIKIPMTAMCALNAITCFSVMQINRSRKVVIRTVKEKKNTKLLDLTLQRRPRVEVRITKMILATSWCYILFNLPSNLFRICIMFKSFYHPEAVISSELFVWQQCLLFVIFTRLALTFPSTFHFKSGFQEVLSICNYITEEEGNSQITNSSKTCRSWLRSTNNGRLYLICSLAEQKRISFAVISSFSLCFYLIFR